MTDQRPKSFAEQPKVPAPNEYSRILSTSPSGQVKLVIIFVAVILKKMGLLLFYMYDVKSILYHSSGKVGQYFCRKTSLKNSLFVFLQKY